MFSICPQNVYKNKDLNGIDIKVYLSIQGFADENGFCFPSINKIADICGVCRRTIERSLTRLESAKVIVRTKRIKKDGGFTSNGYYLKLEPADDTTKLSQGISQESRNPYDTIDATNKNQCNNIYYNINTRADAREEFSKEVEPVLGLDDLNDVLECEESVDGAEDYKFLKISGDVLACRPRAEFLKNAETETKIINFFDYTIKREIKILDFHEFSQKEIEIVKGA